MGYLDRISNFLGKIALKIAAVVLIYMVLHIIFEIVLRLFFSKSTYVMDSFVGYGMAAITFLSMAYSMRDGSLIRVNIALTKMRGVVRDVFEIVGLAATLVVSCFFIYFFWTKIFWRNLIRERVSPTIVELPLYVPEVFVVLGLFCFALQVIVLLIVAVRKLSND